MSEQKIIMLGNQAIARGAYEAGVKVSSAYPGTPSTDIREVLATYDEVYADWARFTRNGRPTRKSRWKWR